MSGANERANGRVAHLDSWLFWTMLRVSLTDKLTKYNSKAILKDRQTITKDFRPDNPETPHQTRRMKLKTFKFSFLPALASSAKMHPADHMSMEVEYSLAPNNTSGGRYLNTEG